MATLARRLAFFAALGAATFAFSGCHEMLLLVLGGKKDPPVHRPAGPARAAAGTPFTGTAKGELAGPIKLTHGFVKSKIRNARFQGKFKATTANPSLGPLSEAQWHGRFTGVRNRETGRIKLRGLILATFTDPSAGRACLKLSHRGRRGQNKFPRRIGRSTITVLGGEGGAKTLGGSATARVRVKGHRIRLKGNVRRRQRAETGFTPACTKLEKKFNLQPLAD